MMQQGPVMMGPPGPPQLMMGPPQPMGPPMGPPQTMIGPPQTMMGPPQTRGPPMGPPPSNMVAASQQMLPPPGTMLPGPPPPQMMTLPRPPPPQMQGPPGGPPPQPLPPPQQQLPPLAVRGGKHIPLARCRVLYLGSAVPLETAVGLEAVQQPLRERYSGDDGDVPGIDAWCTVFSSGIQMQYVEDKDNVTWFPIQTLHVCAAAKCVVQAIYALNGLQIFVAVAQGVVAIVASVMACRPLCCNGTQTAAPQYVAHQPRQQVTMMTPQQMHQPVMVVPMTMQQGYNAPVLSPASAPPMYTTIPAAPVTTQRAAPQTQSMPTPTVQQQGDAEK